MQQQNQNKKEIKLKASDEVLAGKYSNMVKVAHNKEEFIMDFMSIFPPSGTLNARVIMSPGHMKRMMKALQDNISKYENRFGTIEESNNPPNTHLGFPTK